MVTIFFEFFIYILISFVRFYLRLRFFFLVPHWLLLGTFIFVAYLKALKLINKIREMH